ncbi:MAG: immunity 49 family protein [Clostridia bacterium]|nr:immunity 49 family protein [Clostridia bacterium]
MRKKRDLRFDLAFAQNTYRHSSKDLKKEEYLRKDLIYHDMGESAREIGICRLLMGDSSEALKWFLEASINFEKPFLLLEEDNKIQRGDYSLVSARVGAHTIHMALLARNTEIADRMALRVSKQKKNSDDHPLFRICAYALSHFLLGNNTEALTFIAQNEGKKEGEFREFIYIANIIRTIIEKDQERFNEELQKLLTRHHNLSTKGYLREQVEGYICIPGIALSILAKQAGLKVEVDNPYMPKELI